MATIAEAFIIKLGLDAKDVKKGGQDVERDLKKVEGQANKTGNQLEKTSKQGKEFFSSFSAGILSLIAAVGAARVVKSFFDDAIKGMAALGRSSEYLTMSARDLDAWGGAVESVGGNADEAKSSLMALAQGITEFKFTGQSALAPVLNHLGLDLRNFASQADPIGKLAIAVASKLKGLSPQDALFFGKKLGFSENFINLIRQGSVSVAAIVEQFRKASGVSDTSVKSAERAQAAWALLRARFAGIRDELEGRLTPVVQRLLERFADWIDKNRELITSRLIDWIQRFANWIQSIDWDKVEKGATDLLKAINGIASAIEKGAEAIGGWKNVLIGFGAILALNLLTPITSIVGGLGRMIPMLVSARAGILGLAAAAGYWVGSKISEQLEGTKAGDLIGEGVTRVLAALGNGDAQDALEGNLYSQGTAEDQGKLKANYLMMNASQKAQYEKEHPALARQIKSGLVSQRVSEISSDKRYYTTHSAIYGNPEDLFKALEAHENLPSGILSAIFKQESSGGKNLLSEKGAKGPFQFTDETASDYGLSGNDVYDLDKSGAAAARYLHKLIDKFGGRVDLALAGYNAGPGNVQKYGGIPPFAETQSYVSNILPQLGSVNGTATSSIDNTRTSEVSIGTIQVNAPHATDAKGIASELPGALRRNSLIAQSVTALN